MLACVRTVAEAVDTADAADALFSVCVCLTPRIERHPDHPQSQDTLVLDLSGCERLVLGGHHAWQSISALVTPSTPPERLWSMLAARLHHRLSQEMGAPTVVGLGPSCTVAWLAATTSPASWMAITSGKVAGSLCPLPIGALRTVRVTVPDLSGMPGAAEMLAVLAQGGIEAVGQVASVSAVALRRCFSAVGMRLVTLATGQDVTTLRV